MLSNYVPMRGVGGFFLGWNDAPTDDSCVVREKDGSVLYFKSLEEANSYKVGSTPVPVKSNDPATPLVKRRGRPPGSKNKK